MWNEHSLVWLLRVGSVRIRGTGFCDADAVVCKGVVHAGNFYLRHVTTHAIHLAHAARECAAALVLAPAQALRMTAQTDLIVGALAMNQGLMRVVTGDTGELPVRTTPATTLFEAERLKSNGRNTSRIHLKHVLSGAMARSTEIHRGCCVQTLWIQD
jgi:hypothetical protein